MSYNLLSKTTPKARKPYRCIWCGESIAVGETHVYQCGAYYGELQANRWHPECHVAGDEYFRGSGEEEFQPYDNERGKSGL